MACKEETRACVAKIVYYVLVRNRCYLAKYISEPRRVIILLLLRRAVGDGEVVSRDFPA
jgi:hypothetical protein